MDIIISGQVGYETALRLYKENKKFLDERFPEFYVEQFLNIGKEEQYADTPCDGVALEDGGLFAALWKLCEMENCGCEIDIKKVPIRQEVIEVCELFDVNPYEVRSAGAVIFVVDGANVAKDAADKNGAGKNAVNKNAIAGNTVGNPYFTVIGKATKDKARVVLMGTDDKTGERKKRFLTPPERQQKDLADARRK